MQRQVSCVTIIPVLLLAMGVAGCSHARAPAGFSLNRVAATTGNLDKPTEQ